MNWKWILLGIGAYAIYTGAFGGRNFALESSIPAPLGFTRVYGVGNERYFTEDSTGDTYYMNPDGTLTFKWHAGSAIA